MTSTVEPTVAVIEFKLVYDDVKLIILVASVAFYKGAAIHMIININ